MVHDFLETETVVQLPNPPYSPESSPCDYFLFSSLKSNLTRRRMIYEPQSALCSVIFQCLQGGHNKVYLSALRAWIVRPKTDFC